ncbi:hypothetical protein CLCR_11230 [Cladophialophora carrionii]|uniref:non-specific serine/threonine protein kinase n=1 Tax=Cladophialophora carrionii TaxID=86049 RepID=A0A1C1CBL7_9EURO|nr:hypothetical protein CLCR_11230 [Cladophialophora carrionii]
MAQQHYQGKRLDGSPFENPDLDNIVVHAGRQSRNNPLRTLLERLVGVDFDPIWYQDRTKRGAFGNPDNGESIREFLSRWLYFRSDETEDGDWGPIRPLGRGGYGTVGLWQKRNSQNRIVDEVVCKEMRLPTLRDDPENGFDLDDYEIDHLSNRKLLTEAAIHRDINMQHPGIAPHLRGYKFLQDNGPGTGRYRFYMEYCPNGSLGRICSLYRCWNTFLPEVFVWHVFYSLARACEALRDTPPADSKMLQWPRTRGEDYADIRENLYCLHMDVKPVNFLLGYPQEGQEYPAALLNDFGASAYTSHSGDGPIKNPTDLFWRGTKEYYPTEQSHYGVNWDIPPDGGRLRNQDEDGEKLDAQAAYQRRKEDNKDFPEDVIFEHAFNIYGVGQTMFELVTLVSDERHLKKIRADTLEKFRANGNHQITEADVDSTPPGFYTHQLRHLVYRCLDPNPANRPTQLELMDRTHEGLQLAIERAGGCLPKVYFRDHEINEMPLGNADLEAAPQDFKDLIRSEFVNPDLPKLKLPPHKYRGIASALGYPSWKSFYRRVNPHKRWFRPVGAPPDADPPEETDDDDVDEENSSTKPMHPEGNSQNNDVESDDEEDQGPKPARRPPPSEAEQEKRSKMLRLLITQRHGVFLNGKDAKRLLGKNDWYVERAAQAYARLRGAPSKQAENENGKDDDSNGSDHGPSEDRQGGGGLGQGGAPPLVGAGSTSQAPHSGRPRFSTPRTQGPDAQIDELRRRVQHVAVAHDPPRVFLTARARLALYLEAAQNDIDAAERLWLREYERRYGSGTEVSEASGASASQGNNNSTDNEDTLVAELRRRVHHLVADKPPRQYLITDNWLRQVLGRRQGDLHLAEQLWLRDYIRLYERGGSVGSVESSGRSNPRQAGSLGRDAGEDEDEDEDDGGEESTTPSPEAGRKTYKAKDDKGKGKTKAMVKATAQSKPKPGPKSKSKGKPRQKATQQRKRKDLEDDDDDDDDDTAALPPRRSQRVAKRQKK